MSGSSSSRAGSSPSQNYLLNRSNSNSALFDYDIDTHSNPYRINISLALRGYVSAGLMAFTSTAMVMPFDVGKTLLQVQWIPAESCPLNQYHNLPTVQESEDYLEDHDDEDNPDIYFTQPRPPPRQSLGSISKRSLSGSTTATFNTKIATTHPSRSQPETINTWPEWVLPVVVERGVTDMMRAICKWRGEGFLALWKGQLTTFIIDTISSNLQPLLLSSLFFVSSTPSSISLPLEHHAYPGLPLALSVSSYLITGLLLSPLDLVRTRLIAQSSQLRHRTYSGPLDGLRQIVQKEGGYRSVFFHPTLFFPALVDNLLRPLFHLASPLIIDRFLSIDKSQEPIRYGLAELGLSTAALVIFLPLETIRKRLQLQSRKAGDPDSCMKSCVNLRPKAYKGIVECVYRIVTEEKSGFFGLFRGFNVGLTANFVVFILGLIGHRSADSPHAGNAASGGGGWAEV